MCELDSSFASTTLWRLIGGIAQALLDYGEMSGKLVQATIDEHLQVMIKDPLVRPPKRVAERRWPFWTQPQGQGLKPTSDSPQAGNESSNGRTRLWASLRSTPEAGHHVPMSALPLVWSAFPSNGPSGGSSSSSQVDP